MPSSTEMLQSKAEYKEKERQRKWLEHEKARKERLRLSEEERIMQEERKKREFFQKENHRLEAKRKLKEQQERERLNKSFVFTIRLNMNISKKIYQISQFKKFLF